MIRQVDQARDDAACWKGRAKIAEALEEKLTTRKERRRPVLKGEPR